MNKNLDYIEINREAWNRRTSYHVDSEFYNTPAFIAGKSSLNSIELELLGDVKGKSILHLQCHFGLDSISLSRLGAEVTGVDLADAAITKAKELANETNQDTKFICCDIYDLPQYLDEKFDIVFTSYGTIGWLPDMDKWAQIVSRYLKPTGQFVFAEFHPVVWMFDDDFSNVGYNYFNRDAIIESTAGTYAEKDADESFDHVSWNHPISEVVSALLSSGLELKHFEEYDYSPYDCFSHTEEFEKGKFRIKHIGSKMPMVYSMVMEKSK